MPCIEERLNKGWSEVEEFMLFLRKLLLFQLIVSIGVAIVLWIFDGWAYMAGWLWGSGTETLYLLQLTVKILRCRGKQATEAAKAISVSSAGRLAFVAASVIISTFVFDEINHVAMIIGLVIWQPVGMVLHWQQMQKSV